MAADPKFQEILASLLKNKSQNSNAKANYPWPDVLGHGSGSPVAMASKAWLVIFSHNLKLSLLVSFWRQGHETEKPKAYSSLRLIKRDSRGLFAKQGLSIA
jgi:hypothetical protein